MIWSSSSPKTTTERREEFQRVALEAEALAESNPSAYRFRVAMLGLLGYGVLFGALGLLVSIIAGSVWAALTSTAFLILLLKKKLIFVLGGLVYVLARALWVKLAPPEGYPLTRERFPKLFAEIDDLQRRLQTPKIHNVVMTPEFNAGISQTPRLGVFGWTQNTLILGLELLLALPPEQARAVLAHEFGHLSGNHSRFAGRIYRLRTTWYRIMGAFEQATDWGALLFRRFFDWYAPYFNAYAFALSRRNEYEADAVSVEMTSPQATAAALINTYTRDPVTSEKFWQPLYRQADTNPLPPTATYTALSRHFRSQPDSCATLQASLQKQLAVQTDHGNTHPSLHDRLNAIGATPSLPATSASNAAECWLGDRYRDVIADFNARWAENIRDAWNERHSRVKENRELLCELEAIASEQRDADQRWQVAMLTEQFHPDRDAIPLYEHYRQLKPDDLDADFAIGRVLLGRKDGQGVDFMQRATAKFSLARPACEWLHGYYQELGDRQQAERWLRAAEASYDRELQAQAERNSLSANDQFVRCRLDPDAIAALCEQLQATGFIKHAWICEKALQHCPESPLYVLVFEPQGWRKKEDERTQALATGIQWPGETFVIMKRGSHAKTAKKALTQATQIL